MHFTEQYTMWYFKSRLHGNENQILRLILRYITQHAVPSTRHSLILLELVICLFLLLLLPCYLNKLEFALYSELMT